MTNELPALSVEQREGLHTTLELHVIRMFNSERWQDRFGAINIAVLTVEHFSLADTRSLRDKLVGELFDQLHVDPEFRVRNELGKLLKVVLLKEEKNEDLHRYFEVLCDKLLKNIQETFERDPEGAEPSSQAIPANVNDSLDMRKMHDTEGWKSLETSMRSLQNIIEAA